MDVWVQGVGLCGPGLDGWIDGVRVLTDEAAYDPRPVILHPPALLPAAERRRTVPTVRLALTVGSEALENAGCDPRSVATVFSSSGGDGDTVHSILEVLASPLREVSPTRFHNSVHNAPSGYWNIAVGSHEPTTSVCGYDASFAVGLLDAAAQATVDARIVALIAYDLPYPDPLAAVRPIASTFGVGLVLSPERTGASLAKLTLGIGKEAEETQVDNQDLERLRRGAPAARSLPLLVALARKEKQTLHIPYVPGRGMTLSLEPL